MTEPLFYEKGNQNSTLKLVSSRHYSASGGDPSRSYSIEESNGWLSVRASDFFKSRVLHTCIDEQEAKDFIAWHKRTVHEMNNPNVIYTEGVSGGLWLFVINVVVVAGFVLGFVLDRISQ